MRFHVTVPVGAVVTLARTFEIEASSEEEAKRLIDTDEALELPDDDYFIIGDEIDEIHSSEMELDCIDQMKVKRVG